MPAEEPMYNRRTDCLVDTMQRDVPPPIGPHGIYECSQIACHNKVRPVLYTQDVGRTLTQRSGCVRTQVWMEECNQTGETAEQANTAGAVTRLAGTAIETVAAAADAVVTTLASAAVLEFGQAT
jgi:hypothetical protein